MLNLIPIVTFNKLKKNSPSDSIQQHSFSIIFFILIRQTDGPDR